MKKSAVFLMCLFASFTLLADITVYTPALVAPKDGADYQAPNVLLDWEAVAGGIDLHYDVQISLNNGFTDPTQLTTTMSSINTSELLFDTEYFWRVRAVDQTGTSNWSPARSFKTVDVVELSKPKKNGTDIVPDVFLEWDKSSEITGITHYDVEIDQVNTFDSPNYHRFLIPFVDEINKYQMENLLFGVDYFWRVRAIHSKDTTEWSQVWKFTTLETFELKRPKNKAVDQNPDQELIWDDVSGADAYLYQIDIDPNFSMAKTYETINDRANADKLHFGETYYWRVLAYHELDSTEWTDAFQFTTIDHVNLLLPDDGQGGLGIFPTFQWESITGILSYCLEIDDTPDFSTDPIHKSVPAGEASKVTYELPGPALDSATTYYWRVCALHEYDSTGWGTAWSFTVAATAIDDPVLNAASVEISPNPGNGLFTVTLSSPTAESLQVTVMDLVGQQVKSMQWDLVQGSNSRLMDIQDVPAGIYMLRLQKANAVVTKKLLIQR
ncbi:MAG: T9SS type A sorting domain-containing protein [Bacteroidales bacterium]|nr:T9SS type A sorting domain-containing protein [Lentimicrobiaceae bacterium]MDD5695821.1 T9SS type A sorting domain-containing protein [Bacteroidales bacterium]